MPESSIRSKNIKLTDSSGIPINPATETTLLIVSGDTTSIDGKITTCNTGAIAGSVTANAGTNLNTSALSTEATLAKLTSTYNQISIASDNITTINYTDATKTAVSTIVQSSVSVGLTATETFNNSGATTLVITRVVV